MASAMRPAPTKPTRREAGFAAATAAIALTRRPRPRPRPAPPMATPRRAAPVIGSLGRAPRPLPSGSAHYSSRSVPPSPLIGVRQPVGVAWAGRRLGPGVARGARLAGARSGRRAAAAGASAGPAP